MKSFEKDFYSSGKIDAALTRIDHLDALNVYGVLGTFSLITSPSITSVTTLQVMPADVDGVTSGGGHLAFNALSDSVVIDPTLTGLLSSGDNNWLLLFPNPANDQLTIQTGNEIIQQVELASAKGENFDRAFPGRKEFVLTTKHLNAGIYFLNVITDKKIYHRKIQVIH